MSDILGRITADKRNHVAECKRRRPLAELVHDAAGAPALRGFARHLDTAVGAGRYGLIAEIKKASPSGGLIRPDFDPAMLARAYRAGGATCLSVLTDTPYFQGKNEDLAAAHMAGDLPVLRKDFIIDPYQVIEARAIGADCILLIMAALDDVCACELEAAASEFGMDVLIEVHDEAELDRAMMLKSGLIGINNRNLKTLTVDLATTERLAPRVPADRRIVCESGLKTAGDLARMSRVRAQCFLVGESLMRQADVAEATRALLGEPTVATSEVG